MKLKINLFNLIIYFNLNYCCVEDMYKKILLPTDGSEYAEKEIDRALNVLADDGEIIIVSVAKKLRAAQFQSKKYIRELNETSLKESEKNVEEMDKKIPDNIKTTTKVAVGFPAEVINDIAEEEDVDLVVISSSGKSGIHKFFLGSVAEKVVSTVEKDVLLIHNTD